MTRVGVEVGTQEMDVVKSMLEELDVFGERAYDYTSDVIDKVT